MSDLTRLTRNYELSVWTLQDGFIAVLGASGAQYRGRVQNPEINLVNDGTSELTFSIPMYLDNGIERKMNPNWKDIYNAQTIAGMRKIKVIFNKHTDVERVFEFMITKVTKIHESDKPQCDVTCEGLAFHELGKIGYKLEFSTDTVSEESYQWYKDKTGEEPVPTLDYWCTKALGLTYVPNNPTLINSSIWYYKVEMDWSDYAHSSDIPRLSNKIYEEEYTVAWTEELLPKDKDSVISYREKTRTLDEKESNIYNLTQKLAETFGIFCRYDYGYDENYHITSRTIVFYNTGVSDKNRKLSFSYPYSSTKISREDDCTDIVTKMYVTAIEDQTTDSGLITIMSSDANPTQEDYLLNFDYLHEIHTISDEQYADVKTYEKEIRRINDELVPINNALLIKEDRLPKVEALVTTAKNAMALDTERINNSRRLVNALTEGTGIISITGSKAKTAALLPENEDKTSFYIKAPEIGILPQTLKIYFTYTNGALSNQLSGKFEYDEFHNLTQIKGIPLTALNGSNRRTAYLTFDYSPKLYYEQIEAVWRARLAKDEGDYTLYNAEVTTLNNDIATLKTDRETKLAEKAAVVKEFERMMGPALREGYWTPDNYDVTAGERYTDYFIPSTATATTAGGTSNHTSFIWDKELFDDEQKGTYQLGIQQTEKAYPCIKLTSAQVTFIKNNWDQPLGILYYDYRRSAAQEHREEFLRCLAIGSSAIPVIIYSSSGGAEFALLITEASSWTAEEISFLKSSASGEGEARIGYLKTAVVNNQLKVTAEPTSPLMISASQWVTLDSSLYVCYPRCKIDSLTLKNNETDLNITYNGVLLQEFEDYYTLQRVDSATESNYYITLKPETLLKQGTLGAQWAVRFVLSNSSTAIYLDAREILKENSKPKVTYSVDPNVFYDDFMYTDYNALNRIAFINDFELEFDGAQGYISKLSLNLDFPDKDNIEIKNYKNKFEDLFSTIVAQTEAMEKNETAIAIAARSFNIDGSLTESALTGALKKVDLNYAFNNGKLTISEKDGIWGTSDSGVVAFRGGGIFTATQKDSSGNWIWNTGIVPEGINAELITAGQLDTAKIKIYSGDKVRFQLNSDGLFAYKSYFSDYDIGASGTALSTLNTTVANSENAIDFSQYLVVNSEGLFLNAKKGAYVLKANKSEYKILTKDVTRVSINWQGFTIRNWDDDAVFFANADTGDLTVRGTIYATGLYISGSDTPIDTYLNNHTYEFGATVDGFYSTYSTTTSSLQRKTSLIQDDGQILLSACTFDSEGIGDLSKIKITPTQITIGSSGSIDIAAGKINMSAVNNLQNSLDGKYTTISGISITTDGVDITGSKHINLDVSAASYLHLSPTMIDMKSGSIKINGEPIWERNDIIYSYTDPRSTAGITVPSDRAWLWVKPIGTDSQQSSWSGNAASWTATGGSIMNTPSSGGITYTIDITYKMNFSAGSTATTYQGVTIHMYIYDQKNHNIWTWDEVTVDFAGSQGQASSHRYWTIQENLFADGGAIDFEIDEARWGNYYNNTLGITGLTCVIKAEAEVGMASGSQCIVYYFPKT